MDERQHVQTLTDLVLRVGFHDHAGAADVRAVPDLADEPLRVQRPRLLDLAIHVRGEVEVRELLGSTPRNRQKLHARLSEWMMVVAGRALRRMMDFSRVPFKIGTRAG